MRGHSVIIRYADDCIVGFEHAEDAQRFMQVLPKRLARYGLRVNERKSQLIEFGKRLARQRDHQGRPLPTLDFLGFTHYWGKSRQGKVRLKRKTSKKSFRRGLSAINQWLRQQRNAQKLPELWEGMGRKLRGHFNYFGVSDNSRYLYRFEREAHRLLLKWLNRRSQRRSFTWESFRSYQRRFPLPRPGRLVSLNPVW